MDPGTTGQVNPLTPVEIDSDHQTGRANYFGRIHRPTAGLATQIKDPVTTFQETVLLLSFFKLINRAGRITFLLGPFEVMILYFLQVIKAGARPKPSFLSLFQTNLFTQS